MRVSQKVLIFVFVVLLIIISGEIGYLFFFSSKNNYKNSKINEIGALQPTPTVKLTSADLVANEVKKLFNQGKTQEISKLILTREYEGIIETATNENKILSNVLPFQAKFLLTFKTNKNNLEGYYFNDRDLTLIKVYKIINDEKKELKMEDLHSGDNIKITITSDLLKLPETRLIDGQIIILL